jgi:hypothetical protein
VLSLRSWWVELGLELLLAIAIDLSVAAVNQRLGSLHHLMGVKLRRLTLLHRLGVACRIIAFLQVIVDP